MQDSEFVARQREGTGHHSRSTRAGLAAQVADLRHKGLPQWFLDDERKFAQPSGYGVDLDGEMVDRARNGLKEITARSIGKVAEAKARKQRRMQSS